MPFINRFAYRGETVHWLYTYILYFVHLLLCLLILILCIPCSGSPSPRGGYPPVRYALHCPRTHTSLSARPRRRIRQRIFQSQVYFRIISMSFFSASHMAFFALLPPFHLCADSAKDLFPRQPSCSICIATKSADSCNRARITSLSSHYILEDFRSRVISPFSHIYLTPTL